MRCFPSGARARRAGAQLGRTAAVLALAVLPAGLGSAQGAVPPPAAPSAQSAVPPPAEPYPWTALGFRGFLLYKNYSFFDSTPQDDQTFVNQGILQLEWARRFAPWGDVKIVGRVQGDDAGFTDGVYFEVPETNPKRSIVELHEVELRTQSGPLTLLLGKQIFAWGSADGFNPTDTLNPYDYLDPVDNEKIAVYSAALRLTLGPTDLTAVVVPAFTPSRTPLPDSRWVPTLPADASVTVQPREIPPVTFDNIQYAGRLRATVAGWDLAASYFEGFETTPVFRLSDSHLTPIFTRMRVPGFDIATTFQKLEVHAEGAFKLVVRDGKDDLFQGVAGGSYHWDELDLTWLERVTLLLEYARQEVLSSRSGTGIVTSNGLTAFGVPLLGASANDVLFTRLELRFDDRTQFAVAAAIALNGSPSEYVQLKLTHTFWDVLQLEAGVDLFGGPSNTFWGRWSDNSRFFANLKYYF